MSLNYSNIQKSKNIMKKEIIGQYSYINASSQSNLANKYVHICVYIWIYYFITKGNVFQECKIDIQKSVNGNQCIGRIKGERVWSFFRYSKNILSESASIHKKTQTSRKRTPQTCKEIHEYLHLRHIWCQNKECFSLNTGNKAKIFILLPSIQTYTKVSQPVK